MRRKRFGFPLFLALLASLFIAPSALSLYLVNQALDSFDFDIVKGNQRAVAVIASDMNTYYASVEGALKAATSKGGSQTVYVLPGISNDSNPIVIDEDCTVSSGVTLSLPYAQSGDTFTTGFENTDAKDIYGSGTNFADSTPPSLENTSRKSLVLLEEGVNLKIESGGRLVVGGALGTGSGGSNVLGMTSGSYAELAMASGSSIDCLGTFDVRGYVKPWDESDDDGEDGCRITIGTSSSSGASLQLPLVFYGFEGGSNVLSGSAGITEFRSWDGSAINGVFPFEIFDLPNVSVPYTVYEGNEVDCTYAFRMSALGTTYTLGGSLNLVGEDNAIMTLTSEGSSMRFDYEPAATYEASRVVDRIEETVSRGLTIKDALLLKSESGWPSDPSISISISETGMARTRVVITGDARTNDVAISFKGLDIGGFIPVGDAIEVNTGGGSVVGVVSYDPLAIPFSYKWDISVGGGTMSIPNHVKFLPGSRLEIRSGGTLSVTGELAGVNSRDGVPLSSYYPQKQKDKTTSIDSSLIQNGGTISVASGARFGGEVEPIAEGSVITFAGGEGSVSRGADAYESGYLPTLGNYGPKNFASRAVTGTSGENARMRDLPWTAASFSSVAGSDGGFYYSVGYTYLSLSGSGLDKASLMIDGEERAFQEGVSVEAVIGAEVGIRYPSSLTNIEVIVDGAIVEPHRDQADGSYSVVSFAATKASHSIEVREIEPISISGATVTTEDKQHNPYTITWTVADPTGVPVAGKSGSASLKGSNNWFGSNAETATFSGFPLEGIYPGYIITFRCTGDSDGNSITLSLNGNEGEGSVSYTFQEGDNGKSLSVSSRYTDPGCIVEGTLIDMADGSSKKVEDLVPGDMVMAFDHETGKEVASPVLCVDVESRREYTVSDLFFSNGTSIGIAFEHGFFDRTLNEYVYLTPENAESYIGHEFYSLGGENLVLEDVETSRKEVALYSPVTACTLNLFHEGLLGIAGGIEGFFNVFEYGEDMAYDPVKKSEDIAKYGLYSYEDVSSLISKEAFDLLPVPYLKVAVGKGMITWEDIVRMARMFGDLLPQ